jgi:hypothetical protein
MGDIGGLVKFLLFIFGLVIEPLVEKMNSLIIAN